MPADPAFDIVAQLEVEQANFSRDLKSAEQAVTRSSDKMQTQFERTNAKVGNLQVGLAAMGAAGTLAGSSLGGVASAAAGFAGALNALQLGLGPVTIGVAAVALAVLQFKDVVFDASDGVNKLEGKMLDLGTRVSAARRELQVLDGTITEAQSRAFLYQESLEGLTKAEAALAERLHETTEAILAKKAANEQAKSDKAEADRGSASFAADRQAQIDRQAAFNRQIESQRNILNLQTQLANEQITELEFIERSGDALTAKERSMLFVAQQARTARDMAEAEANALASSEQSLARSLAIRTGLAKSSDFARSDRERQLLLIQESLGAQAPQATGGGGFSIGTRQASEFIGFAGQNLQLGQQREQEKTNEKLDEANRLNQRQIDVLLELANGTGLN